MTSIKRNRSRRIIVMTIGLIVLLSCFNLAGNLVYAAEPTVRIDDLKYDETIKVGQDSHLTGNVVCSDQIAIIEVGIVDLNTHDWTTHKYTNYYVNSKTFDLARADSDLDVKTLPEGTFIYRIYVHTVTGHSLVALDVRFYITKDGVVKEEQSSTESQTQNTEEKKPEEKQAKITLKRMYYPKSLNVGQDYDVRGGIYSDQKMKSLEIGIVDKNDKWVYKYSNNKVNATYFACSKSDSSLAFKKLAAGTYYYRINVTTKAGTQTALNKEFTVKKPNYKVTLKRMAKPGTLTAGKSFSVRGGVYTPNAMKSIVVGIVDTNGKWLYKYSNSKVNSSYFALSRSDSKLLFSKLSPGTYYYRIKTTTKDGTKTALNHEFKVVAPTLTTEFLRMYYPKELKIGTDYNIRGRINTNIKMTKLEVGIVNKATGNWEYKYTNSKVNAKTFAFSAADSSLQFKKLPVGTYYYRINVFTKYGSKQAYNKAFTVVDPEAEKRAKAEAEAKAKAEAEAKAKAEAEAKAKAEAEAKAKAEAEAAAAAAANSPKATTTNAKLTAGTYLNGIDVSTFQGDVNWAKVKPSGVDFAIIRAGYRGYTSGSLAEDNKFKKNMTGAKAAGLKVGVYFFSQAINYNEGVAEANYVCDLLEKNGFKVDFPIAVDSEYISSSKPGRADKITKAARTQAIKGFCDQIKKRGYEPMIYASTSWFDSKLDMNTIGDVKLWAAQWSSTVPTDRKYTFWQYTSDGEVPGISGRVDMDVWFK